MGTAGTAQPSEAMSIMQKLEAVNWNRVACFYVRIALAAAFLSAVASRFGLWHGEGSSPFFNLHPAHRRSEFLHASLDDPHAGLSRHGGRDLLRAGSSDRDLAALDCPGLCTPARHVCDGHGDFIRHQGPARLLGLLGLGRRISAGDEPATEIPRSLGMLQQS